MRTRYQSWCAILHWRQLVAEVLLSFFCSHCRAVAAFWDVRRALAEEEVAEEEVWRLRRPRALTVESTNDWEIVDSARG